MTHLLVAKVLRNRNLLVALAAASQLLVKHGTGMRLFMGIFTVELRGSTELTSKKLVEISNSYPLHFQGFYKTRHQTIV